MNPCTNTMNPKKAQESNIQDTRVQVNLLRICQETFEIMCLEKVYTSKKGCLTLQT